MPDTSELSPHELQWTRVSPKYVSVRLVGALVRGVVWTLVTAVPLILVLLGVWDPGARWWLWALPGLMIVITLIDLALVVRRVRAIGYAEADTELWLRKGLLFRTVTVVPYGRMQYVEIKTGPVLNAFGLATVTLHTAAAATNAELPGIAREEADRLREQLTRRGEEHMVGL